MNLKTTTYSNKMKLMEGSGTSSFRYKIPTNKKQLLYDFYLLTALPIWGLEGSGTKAPHPDAKEIISVVKDTQKKLVDYLKEEQLDILEFAIASEIRHIIAFIRLSVLDKMPKDQQQFAIKFAKKLDKKTDITDPAWRKQSAAVLGGYKKPTDVEITDIIKVPLDFYNSGGRAKSYKIIKSMGGFTPKFMKTAKAIFDNNDIWGGWSDDYGGPAWGQIVQGWQKLNKASSYEDKVVYIDHVFDLQHNTDSVFNKIESYADGYSGHEWIGKALDKKKHARSLFDLIDDVSPALKYFSARIIKAATGETLQSWSKSKHL